MKTRWAGALGLTLYIAAGCGGDVQPRHSTAHVDPGQPAKPPEYPIAWAWPADETEKLATAAGLHHLEAGRPLARTSWKGYVTTVLLEYLDEKHHMDLLSSRFDDVSRDIEDRQEIPIVILTAEHRRRFGRRLAEINPPQAKLRRFYEAFSGEHAPGIGAGMLESLDAVRASLRATDSKTVAVVELLD